MPRVRIRTLGSLDVTVDDQSVDWLSSQRMRAACLVYIAVEREASRDRLQAVFWPNADGDRARRSLNQTIYTIRRSLGEDTVVTDGDRVRIAADVDVDAADFIAAAEASDHTTALSLYGGRFLADTTLSDSAAFEQWVDSKRASLERMHRRVARAAIDVLVAANRESEALQLAQDWCAVDPDEDEAHHQCIALLIQLGSRTQALRHFDEYAARMKASDLQPLEETVALIAPLRAGKPVAQPSASPPTATPARLPTSVPAQAKQHGLAAFIHELKRRHVISTVGVYLVISYGAMEVANNLVPALHLPEWTPTLIVLLALLALPFVIFFAWVYDVTPEGIQRTGSAALDVPTLPRLRRGWVAIVIMLAAGTWAGWQLVAPDGPDTSGTLAIFPFCSSGVGIGEKEAEDVAVYLARQVDAIPEFHTADPNIVITNANDAKLNCRDARTAGALARKVGATQMMLGSLTRTDKEIRATAELYDSAGAMKWAVTGTAPSEVWTQVVDSLLRKVLEEHSAHGGDKLYSVAARTTHNQQALLAFLDGQRAQRELAWAKAADNYLRAVQLDSTYAAAWFRLSVTLLDMGAGAAKAIEALRHAQRYAAVLPEREQRLIYAFDGVLSAPTTEAVSRLRNYLGKWPDDAEVWWLLGDLLSGPAALVGHDLREAQDAYERASALGNRDAMFMLAWGYWDVSDPRADSMKKEVFATSHAGDWVAGLEAVRVFQRGDPKECEAMWKRILSMPEGPRESDLQWTEWSHNYDLWESYAERRVARAANDAERAQKLGDLVRTKYMRGKIAETLRLIDQLEGLDPQRALRMRIAIAKNPLLPPNMRNAAVVLQTLQGWWNLHRQDADSAESLRTKKTVLYELGRLSVINGDLKGAEQYAATVAQLPEEPVVPHESANLAAAIRAHVALARRDTTQAMAWLTRIVNQQNPWTPGGHSYAAERAVRAEILAARGKIAEAARWYFTTGDDYDPLAWKRSGELLEKAARPADAIIQYRKVSGYLAAPDRGLQPLRDFARARLAALGAPEKGAQLVAAQ